MSQHTHLNEEGFNKVLDGVIQTDNLLQERLGGLHPSAVPTARLEAQEKFLKDNVENILINPQYVKEPYKQYAQQTANAFKDPRVSANTREKSADIILNSLYKPDSSTGLFRPALPEEYNRSMSDVSTSVLTQKSLSNTLGIDPNTATGALGQSFTGVESFTNAFDEKIPILNAVGPMYDLYDLATGKKRPAFDSSTGELIDAGFGDSRTAESLKNINFIIGNEARVVDSLVKKADKLKNINPAKAAEYANKAANRVSSMQKIISKLPKGDKAFNVLSKKIAPIASAAYAIKGIVNPSETTKDTIRYWQGAGSKGSVNPLEGGIRILQGATDPEIAGHGLAEGTKGLSDLYTDYASRDNPGLDAVAEARMSKLIAQGAPQSEIDKVKQQLSQDYRNLSKEKLKGFAEAVVEDNLPVQMARGAVESYYGVPSPVQQQRQQALENMTQAYIANRSLARQQHYNALKEQGALGEDLLKVSPDSPAFKERYNKDVMQAYDALGTDSIGIEAARQANKMYNLGLEKDLYSNPKKLEKYYAYKNSLKQAVGPYWKVYDDLLRGSKGKYSLLPRTYEDLAKLRQITGKASPGEDYYAKTKANSFAEVLEDLQNSYKVNSNDNKPADTAATNNLKNEFELAKSTANNRIPTK